MLQVDAFSMLQVDAFAINLEEIRIHFERETLGSRTFAKVYQGTYRGETVAVKVLNRGVLGPVRTIRRISCWVHTWLLIPHFRSCTVRWKSGNNCHTPRS